MSLFATRKAGAHTKLTPALISHDEKEANMMIDKRRETFSLFTFVSFFFPHISLSLNYAHLAQKGEKWRAKNDTQTDV